MTYEFILQEQANQKACNQYRGTSNYQICLDRTYIGIYQEKKELKTKYEFTYLEILGVDRKKL